MLAELLHGHAVLLYHRLRSGGGVVVTLRASPKPGSEVASTHLADEGEGLAPHPLGTVAEPDGELVDEVQAQVVGAARVQLLEDLYHLRAHGEESARTLGIVQRRWDVGKRGGREPGSTETQLKLLRDSKNECRGCPAPPLEHQLYVRVTLQGRAEGGVM